MQSDSSGRRMNEPPRRAKGEETQPSTSMTLRFGDSESPETWTVSEDLRRIVEEASNLNLPESARTRFPISFTTLLRSLFSTGSSWTYWLMEIGRESGLRLEGLTSPPVVPGEFERPLRATLSAERLLKSARGFAGRSSVVPDVQHLIAALIYQPLGHDEDLASYRFDRLTWGHALIAEVERRAPADVELLTSLRDQAFPITKEPVSSSPPDGPESSSTERLRREVWERADSQCKESFAWAETAVPTD